MTTIGIATIIDQQEAAMSSDETDYTDSLPFDLGNRVEAYADGIGRIVVVGPNVRMMLFAWRWIDNALRKVVTAEIVMPQASFPEALLADWRRRFKDIDAEVVRH
jgi:hypothetical protein